MSVQAVSLRPGECLHLVHGRAQPETVKSELGYLLVRANEALEERVQPAAQSGHAVLAARGAGDGGAWPPRLPGAIEDEVAGVGRAGCCSGPFLHEERERLALFPRPEHQAEPARYLAILRK